MSQPPEDHRGRRRWNRGPGGLLVTTLALGAVLAGCGTAATTDPLNPQSGTAAASDTANQLVALSFVSARTGVGIAEPQTSTGLALPLRLERTSDGGSSWHAVGPLPGTPAAAGAVRLLFTTPDAGLLRLGGGLFSTTDGGHRWSRVALPGRALGVAGSAARIWAAYTTCPSSPPGVVTARSCSAGVEVSVDGGRSWAVQPGVTAAPYEAGQVVAAGTTDAYFGLWRGTSGASPAGTLFSTTDGGATWTGQTLPCPSGYQLGGAVSSVPGSPVLWLACTGQSVDGVQGKALFHSGDGGATWSAGSGQVVGQPTGVPDGAPPGALENLHAVSSTDVLVLTLNDGLTRSVDGGATFRTAVGSIAGYQSTLDFADQRHGWAAAYVATAGSTSGLWRTVDGGGSWSVVPGG